MWLNNMKIGRKITSAFAALVVITGGVSFFVTKSIGDMDEASHWNTHTYEVLERATQLIAGMVDQETGVRGFLVSGDEKFLEPYIKGQDAFASAFQSLKKLTSDNPAQQKRLDELKLFAEKWKTQVAEPEIALMRNPSTKEQARALEASGAGKTAMDGIREIEHEFDAAERSLLITRTAAR